MKRFYLNPAPKRCSASFMWLSGLILSFLLASCSKNGGTPTPPPPPPLLRIQSLVVDGKTSAPFRHTSLVPEIRYQFSAPVNKATLATAFDWSSAAGVTVPYAATWSNGDSVLLIKPTSSLPGLSAFVLSIGSALKSVAGGSLGTARNDGMTTGFDLTPKFPAISNDSLMSLVQRQTLRYFTDFAHPVSGMARERNTSGDLVTTGGTGFGVMSMVAGAERGFITRANALQRVTTIVDFLSNKATRYKGAFAHWLNGATGATIPFSANDDGADLVETGFLMMGLLTAKAYFDRPNTEELALRQSITKLYDEVQWNWFRRNEEQALYWHWSPDKQWAMNMKIEGWNECLITYVLAAGSKNYSIPASVYKQGYARSGGIRNGRPYYGINLPLGPDFGGPLFFSHYSFLGLDPRQLSDEFATNYFEQNKSHSLINKLYCTTNPRGFFGYGPNCWGLTASDIPNGYAASSPTEDRGVIAPTAAISSMPYTPTESMDALRFFYYTLGDRIFKDYGFTDAFALDELWFASSFLAIDQGPQMVMIENHRTGLLWRLFRSLPEVKAGLVKLGFSAPYL